MPGIYFWLNILQINVCWRRCVFPIMLINSLVGSILSLFLDPSAYRKLLNVKVIDDEEYEKNKTFTIVLEEPILLDVGKRHGELSREIFIIILWLEIYFNLDPPSLIFYLVSYWSRWHALIEYKFLMTLGKLLRSKVWSLLSLSFMIEHLFKLLNCQIAWVEGITFLHLNAKKQILQWTVT